MNCLVVDDEPLALSLLADYITRIPGLTLADATSDAVKALELAKSGSIDLVFLDMQMPELNGLQFLKILQRRCPVIITSAYADYALHGYEHHVVDYLLKPITLERFMIAVEKVKERAGRPAAAAPAQPQPVDHIFVKTDYRIVRVDLNEVFYLEGARDYVVIHTLTGDLVTLQSLRSLEELLPAERFVRIHKSYIVALSKIGFIERGRVSVNGQLLAVSETFKDRLLRAMGR